MSEDSKTILADESGQMSALPIDFEYIHLDLFWAKLAIDDGDIILQFFQHESRKRDDWFWEECFAKELDRVAREHFMTSFPHLKAARVDEIGIDSWWLRAYKLGMQDPVMSAKKFLVKLQHALMKAMAQ